MKLSLQFLHCRLIGISRVKIRKFLVLTQLAPEEGSNQTLGYLLPLITYAGAVIRVGVGPCRLSSPSILSKIRSFSSPMVLSNLALEIISPSNM